jgi:hypothetical protein
MEEAGGRVPLGLTAASGVRQAMVRGGHAAARSCGRSATMPV